MERTTFTISKEFAEEIKSYDGKNDEERLKKWAGVSSPDLTEERVREIAREEFEEMSTKH